MRAVIQGWLSPFRTKCDTDEPDVFLSRSMGVIDFAGSGNVHMTGAHAGPPPPQLQCTSPLPAKATNWDAPGLIPNAVHEACVWASKVHNRAHHPFLDLARVSGCPAQPLKSAMPEYLKLREFAN